MRQFANLGIIALICGACSAFASDFPYHLLTGEPFAAGEPANNHSYPLSASSDGRFLLIESVANNLLDGLVDANGASDVFLLDRATGALELVSRSYAHPERSGNYGSANFGIDLSGRSADARVSDDGRWVAFVSRATDLVEDFAPGGFVPAQIYLRDRETQTTRLVSHSYSGPSQPGNQAAKLVGMSADGRFTVFTSTASNLLPGSPGLSIQVFLFDRDTDALLLVSHPHGMPGTAAEGDSEAREITPDGRFILVNSRAANLAEGQIGSGNQHNAFVYDRAADTFELLSRNPSNPGQGVGGYAPDFSPDGRFVALRSGAALFPEFLDKNSTGSDCFLMDRQSGTVHLASRSQESSTTSGDQRSVCDQVSHDGRYVFFSSDAGNLVVNFVDNNDPSHTDIFVYDDGASVVSLVSHASGEAAAGANNQSFLGTSDYDGLPYYSVPSSLDDRYLIFKSVASDLVAGSDDNTYTWDLFLYDRTKGVSQLVTRSAGAGPPTSGCPLNSSRAMLTQDGSVFFSCPQMLDTGVLVSHGESQIFRFDLSAQDNRRLVTATPLSGITMDRLQEFVAMVSRNGRWLSRGNFLWDMETGNKLLVGHALLSPTSPAEYGIFMGDVTSDGRFASYETFSTDVAAVQDENGAFDVYVYERATDTAHLISHAAGQPNQTAVGGSSFTLWLSDDGNQVLSWSNAFNIVAGCSCSHDNRQIYFYDRTTQQAEMISHGSSSLTEGGLGDAYFLPGFISTDASAILYVSAAVNHVAGFVDGNGSSYNLYYYDRATHQSFLVDHVAGKPTRGESANAVGAKISADGSSVFYTSTADDLVAGQVAQPNIKKLFRWSKATHESELVVHPPGDPTRSCEGDLELHDFTSDGQRLLLVGTCQLVAGDTNSTKDLYLYDRVKGQAELISHQPGDPNLSLGVGVVSGSRLSQDASKVVYRTDGNFVYAYDRAKQERKKVLTAYYDPEEVVGGSFSVSDDGNRLLLETESNQVVPFDSNYWADYFYVRLDELFSDGFESGSTAAWSQTFAMTR